MVTPERSRRTYWSVQVGVLLVVAAALVVTGLAWAGDRWAT